MKVYLYRFPRSPHHPAICGASAAPVFVWDCNGDNVRTEVEMAAADWRHMQRFHQHPDYPGQYRWDEVQHLFEEVGE